MSKKIQLSIPKPCHENWENMTPVDKGKFCGSCQKQVVDFSRMSDREVAQFFKKPSTGSVCGRFMQDQLDRDIEIPRKRIPWVKYFFQFALPAFLVSMKTSAQTTRIPKKIAICSDTLNPKSPRLAKLLVCRVPGLTVYNTDSNSSGTRITVGEPKVEQIPQEVRGIACGNPIKRRPKELSYQIEKDTIPPTMMLGEISYLDPSKMNKDTNEVSIKGRVIDELNDGIPNVRIISRTGQKSQADINGYFTIKLRKDQTDICLDIFSYGNYPLEVNVDKTMLDKGDIGAVVMKVKRVPKPIFMGMITPRSVQISPAEIKKDTILSRPDKPHIVVVEPAHFKIFPNPVSKGISVTIETISNKENTLQLRIVALDGRLVLSQSLHAVKGVNRFPIMTGESWPGGIYYVQLLDENSKVIATEQIIIQ